MEEFKNSIITSLTSFGDDIVSGLATLAGALGILIGGWLLAKLVRKLVLKVLKKIKLDSLIEKLNLRELLGNAVDKISFTEIIGKIVYYVIMLFILLIVADFMNLSIISEQIGEIINFIPKLISALVIFVAGFYFANIIKKTINAATESIGLSGAKIIGNIVFYIILVFVSITAVDQAGIDTTLITSNIVVILGSAFLAFSIAYSMAARDILKNILSSFYSKGRFVEGQTIKVDDVIGEIEKIDSISVTIKTGSSKIVMPSSQLISEKVEIIKDKSIE